MDSRRRLPLSAFEQARRKFARRNLDDKEATRRLHVPGDKIDFTSSKLSACHDVFRLFPRVLLSALQSSTVENPHKSLFLDSQRDGTPPSISGESERKTRPTTCTNVNVELYMYHV